MEHAFRSRVLCCGDLKKPRRRLSAYTVSKYDGPLIEFSVGSRKVWMPFSSLVISQGPSGSNIKSLLHPCPFLESLLFCWSSSTGLAVSRTRFTSHETRPISIVTPSQASDSYEYVICMGGISLHPKETLGNLANNISVNGPFKPVRVPAHDSIQILVPLELVPYYHSRRRLGVGTHSLQCQCTSLDPSPPGTVRVAKLGGSRNTSFYVRVRVLVHIAKQSIICTLYHPLLALKACF